MIAVNAESARNGGTRTHLRALLAAAPEPFTPVFRTLDGAGWTLAEPTGAGIDAALPLRERLRWERHTLPEALADLAPTVLLQPSNVGLSKPAALPTVQVLHNVAPLSSPLRDLAQDRLLARLLLLRRLTDRAIERAAGVAVLSDLGRDLVLERHPGATVEVVRPGLDDATPGPAPARRPVFLVVAHLFRFKRVEDAIAGFVRSGAADRGFELHVHGGHYDAPYVAELTDQVAASGCEAITFLGSRTPAETREAIRTCTALLQPSACENAPQVVFEARAERTPIVASDIPAHRELLTVPLHGVGRIDEVADLIRQAIDDDLPVADGKPLPTWRESGLQLAELCRSVG